MLDGYRQDVFALGALEGSNIEAGPGMMRAKLMRTCWHFGSGGVRLL
jgi:hypothetical protein